MLPLTKAVVTLSTRALNCEPIKLIPAAVLAVNDPPPENCAQTIFVVPTVTGALVVHTNPESALAVPASTKVKAPGISAAESKSVDLVSTKAAETPPTTVTT